MNSKKIKMILGGTLLASAMVLNSVSAVVTSSTLLFRKSTCIYKR